MKYRGPNPLEALYFLRAARTDPAGVLYALSERYGGVAHLGLGKRHIFLVSSVSGVEQILQRNQHNYRGWQASHETLQPLLGHGLLTAEGETWRRHRRLTQGAFHRKSLALLAPRMMDAIQRYFEENDDDISTAIITDIGWEMTRLTLHVVTEALLGTQSPQAVAVVQEEFQPAMHELVGRMFNPLRLPLWLPTPGNLVLRQRIAALDEVVQAIIAAHRRDGPQDDLLGTLIAAHDAPGEEQLSDQELRDEVMTLLMAGHETCANALTWGLSLLAHHPQVQEQMRAEVESVLGSRPPAFADLERLAYTAQVFHEILRLYPPAWIMAREALCADVIDGWPIPAGALVILSPYINQRQPARWEEPERFDPGRFNPEAVRARPHFAYYPFGGGQRQCLGKNFALVEAAMILPSFIQRYHLRPLDADGPTWRAPLPDITMRPQTPILLMLEKRQPASSTGGRGG